MKIQVMLDLGTPGSASQGKRELRPAAEDPCPKRPIEDEIRDSLELIESGHESSIEWRAIQGLYKQLTQLKQTDRIRNLRNMIKPVLSKYGYHVE